MSPFWILLEQGLRRWWVVTTGAIRRAKLQSHCHCWHEIDERITGNITPSHTHTHYRHCVPVHHLVNLQHPNPVTCDELSTHWPVSGTCSMTTLLPSGTPTHTYTYTSLVANSRQTQSVTSAFLLTVSSADHGGTRPEHRSQLLLSTPAATQHPTITTNRRPANPDFCIHHQSSWLLQQRSVRRLFTSHPSTSDGSARLVVGVDRYEHITPAPCDVLHWLPVPQFEIAISVSDCVREHCPAYSNNVCIPVAGVSGRAHLRSAERHDMLVPSHSLVDGVSMLQPQPSGTRFHHIFAHHPSVVDSSGLGWKQSLHTGLWTPLRTFVEGCILLHLHNHCSMHAVTQ